MKKARLLKIMILGCIAFFAVFCWKILSSEYSVKNLYNHLFQKEEVTEQSIFIIAANESVETDKNGNYIYPELVGKSVVSFQRIIPDSYIDQQQNECVTQLLKKRALANDAQCFSNGYTYVLVSYGETTSSVYIDTQPLSANENGDLILNYKFTISDSASDVLKPVYYLFQIPTNKNVQTIDNSAYMHDFDFSSEENGQLSTNSTGGDLGD